MNFTQTGNGLATDKIRASDGHLMDEHRAENGHSAAIVLEKDACRAGACVFVCCSFCVRSLPVWRSSCVGSCGVRARLLIADAGVSTSGLGIAVLRDGQDTGEIGTD